MNIHKIALAALAAVAVLPLSVSAHESHVYEINGTEYRFVVGSLNEPVTVDDKTGVDLRVSMVGHENMEANDHHGAGGAVEGLQETLKVELIAGDKKKVLDLSTVYNTPGAYKAPFYPTVATTLSYRFFGTLAGTPIDLTFTCSPAGHTQATEDTTRTQMSEGVFRVSKTGAFGCPTPKADLGFPEPTADILSLQERGTDNTMTYGAGLLALAALGVAVMRRRS